MSLCSEWFLMAPHEFVLEKIARDDRSPPRKFKIHTHTQQYRFKPDISGMMLVDTADLGQRNEQFLDLELGSLSSR